jgi:hypothetical protein
MKWATRDHVHMDRVASPWLIKRFVDREAEFVFLPFGKEHPIPADVTPFAIPGVELGPHDEDGSTFRKIMRRYELSDPALELMADIIDSGIHHVFHHNDPGYSVADLKHPVGVGLDALAHGMMYATANDAENVELSMRMYDGLYGYCRAMLLLEAKPEIAQLPPPRYWDRIKEELNSNR